MQMMEFRLKGRNRSLFSKKNYCNSNTSTWKTDKHSKEFTKMPETARPSCEILETSEMPDTDIPSNTAV